jgi:hypothetical protein
MGRKRGSRFQKAKDAQEQLEQIEKAQQTSRKGKPRQQINSIGKSTQRFDNSLNRIKTRKDVEDEYPE